MIIISGSCLNFDKERKKIVEIIEGFQIFVNSQTRCEVSGVVHEIHGRDHRESGQEVSGLNVTRRR